MAENRQLLISMSTEDGELILKRCANKYSIRKRKARVLSSIVH
jgi:hypothetical protein